MGGTVEYTNGDHHVTGLGTVIFNVKEVHTVDEFALHWEAGGVLSDKDGQDGYRWCYWYTLVPRGFGLSYSYKDHEVLQVGFDLGPDTPDIVGNEITWTSQTVLKDEDSEDGNYETEFVTVLSGKSVEPWQPPTVRHLIGASWVEEPTELNLSPEGPSSFCNDTARALEHYKVEKVPFDYAIPVLTGWNLSYECSEHHVEGIGVSIVEFDYDAMTGTLFYTMFSALHDDNGHGHAARYKVSILGLNALDKGSEK